MAFVLVVRDPDSANEITTDGDVQVIDIDLGSSFDGTPNDAKQALDWAKNLERWLADVPVDSPVFRDAVVTVQTAVVDYPDAFNWVDRYVSGRAR